jgi:hypothetical protein
VIQSDQAVWTAFTPEEQAEALLEMHQYAKTPSGKHGIELGEENWGLVLQSSINI